MPLSLMQEIARDINALHLSGSAMIATRDIHNQTDISSVQCVYTDEGYFVYLRDYVPVVESTSSRTEAILLLEQECNNIHLSWFGLTQVVPHESTEYQRIIKILNPSLAEDIRQHCVLQLTPVLGNFCRNGENGISLDPLDLETILNWQEAA